jgi:hypothetical protein
MPLKYYLYWLTENKKYGRVDSNHNMVKRELDLEK